MWIEIKNDIFDSNPNVDELRKLIQDLCYKRRYDFFIDVNNINNEAIFDEFYNDNNAVISEYFEKFITENPKVDLIVTNFSDLGFTVSEAIKYVNKPFQIILENRNNDGYFIDALIREFRSKAKKIVKFKNEDWLRYEMAGGSGIIHYLEAEKKQYDNDLKFLKCFVLIDSDLEYPQNPNPKRVSLIEYFNKNNIPFHILEKREIENYLPLDIIYAIDSNDEFIKALTSLDSKFVDFVDIQNGFKLNINSLKKDKVNVYNYFSILSNEQFNDLRYGINNKFINFKNEYAKLFERATQKGFIERTKKQINPNELQFILKSINDLL
jgi:hypothetical protein